MTRKTKKTSKPPEALDADSGLPAGEGCLSFATDYPQDAHLDALLEAFGAGNFDYVRRHGRTLLEDSDDEAVKRATRDLVSRIHPEPTAIYLWLIGFGLLVFLFGYYLAHAH